MKFSFLFNIMFGFLFCVQVVAQKKGVITTLKQKNQALKDEMISSMTNLFHDKAKIQIFPRKEVALSHEEISEYYESIFKETDFIEVILLDRIVYKGFVIDKELVKTKSSSDERIIFYTFKKEKIKSMTILEGEKSQNDLSITQVVDRQLNAYNNRDLNSFVRTYDENVKVFTFPDRLKSEGHFELRQGYKDWFEKTPNLNCQIEKRIVMGSIVLDQEIVRANGKSFRAIAIYEVSNRWITKVTFIQ